MLRGLVLGAAILRTTDAQGVAAKSLCVTVEDYACVYKRLLNSAPLPSDDPFDPLAVHMVNRANAFCTMLQGANTAPAKMARVEAHAQHKGDFCLIVRHVSRRELSDLGNPRGRTIRKLIEYLLGRGADGYRTFVSLGIIRKLPKAGPWPSKDPSELSRLLRPWSEKQVITHFHKLCQEGLITARKRPKNQAWIYELPEKLADPRSPFTRLPSPEAVAQRPCDASFTAACPDDGAGGSLEPIRRNVSNEDG